MPPRASGPPGGTWYRWPGPGAVSSGSFLGTGPGSWGAEVVGMGLVLVVAGAAVLVAVLVGTVGAAMVAVAVEVEEQSSFDGD